MDDNWQMARVEQIGTVSVTRAIRRHGASRQALDIHIERELKTGRVRLQTLVWLKCPTKMMALTNTGCIECTSRAAVQFVKEAHAEFLRKLHGTAVLRGEGAE